MATFHMEEVEAICQIPLSQRGVNDDIIWLHNLKGLFTVKLAYHVARKLLTDGNRVGTSGGSVERKMWYAIWKLKLPNKIKIFGWRACHDILPTAVNLTRRKVISKNNCPLCMRELESTVHALWDYATVQDIWAGSIQKLQKISVHG